MKKWFLLTALLLTFSLSIHAEDNKPMGPAKPAMKGIHGFSMFKDGGAIYLSHIAKYEKNSRVQLVYQMEVLATQLAFSRLVGSEPIVTFKPDEPFDLQILIAGMPLTVKGTVYIGHFEHGGMPVYRDFEVMFDKQKYVRKFDEGDGLEASSNIKTYDVIQLPRKHRLLIHRIQEKPSYDHLLLLIDDVACPTTFRATKSVPDEMQVYRRLTSCGSIKPMYYSPHDLK